MTTGKAAPDGCGLFDNDDGCVGAGGDDGTVQHVDDDANVGSTTTSSTNTVASPLPSAVRVGISRHACDSSNMTATSTDGLVVSRIADAEDNNDEHARSYHITKAAKSAAAHGTEKHLLVFSSVACFLWGSTA
jgi:hypothetical protein